MATVRIFLLTYRRPALLRRALASLRAQTFTDWMCELHNDDPADAAPAQLLAELADPRITLHPHERNWGPVASFNHACAGAAEPFFSILEDDNWWEPTFLERLLAALAAVPEAELAWSNLRFWQEEADGSWTDRGRTLWPSCDRSHVVICPPQLIQFDGPLHSNGAMLVRSAAARDGRLAVFPECPFFAMENLRERALRTPLVLVPSPLVNFALTRTTARGRSLATWVAGQALMGAAFLRAVPLTREARRRLWRRRREAQPRATTGLLFAGLLARDWRLLREAGPADWWFFLRGVVRRPAVAFAALRAGQRQPALAAAFAAASGAWASAAAVVPPGAIPPLTLADPADLSEALSR